jgi:hypothetical protein
MWQYTYDIRYVIDIFEKNICEKIYSAVPFFYCLTPSLDSARQKPSRRAEYASRLCGEQHHSWRQTAERIASAPVMAWCVRQCGL